MGADPDQIGPHGKERFGPVPTIQHLALGLLSPEPPEHFTRKAVTTLMARIQGTRKRTISLRDQSKPTETAEEALERLRAEWRMVRAEPASRERDVRLRAIELAARAVKIVRGGGLVA